MLGSLRAWPPNSCYNWPTGVLHAYRGFSCPSDCPQVPPAWLNQELRKTGKFVCTGDVPTELVSFPSVTSLNSCWHLRHQFPRHIKLLRCRSLQLYTFKTRCGCIRLQSPRSIKQRSGQIPSQIPNSLAFYRNDHGIPFFQALFRSPSSSSAQLRGTSACSTTGSWFNSRPPRRKGLYGRFYLCFIRNRDGQSWKSRLPDSPRCTCKILEWRTIEGPR